MSRRSREHTSDEFGRSGLGAAGAIGDRGLGAASGVLVDGLVERESGRTPGPGFSGRAIWIGFLAMAAIAAAILITTTVLWAPRPLPAGSYPRVWIGLRSQKIDGADTKFTLMNEPAEDTEVTEWVARVDEQASITINGRPADVTALAEYLEAGMYDARVTARAEGVISRVEVVMQETPEVTR